MLVGAIGLSTLVMGYGLLVGSRSSNISKVGKKSHPDVWRVSLLDCEYSPTKQSYGPARILPVTKVRFQPMAKGCENC
jgi:hypothetical protein